MKSILFPGKQLRTNLFTLSIIILGGFLWINAETISKLPVVVKDGEEYFIYDTKKGESLYGISKRYGWDLEELKRYNPELNKSVKKGTRIYYPTGQNISLPQKDKEDLQNPGPKMHTVKKGENVYSIATKYGVSLEEIYRHNPSITNGVKVGDIVEIPQKSSQKVDYVIQERSDLLQPTQNGLFVADEEIDEIGIEDNTGDLIPVEITDTLDIDRIEPFFNGVRMALILDDPTSKKDIDFSRGILVALSEMEKVPYKIEFKILDGRVSSNELTNELELYNPNLIVVTADKVFPVFLADYGNTNGVKVLNVFDLKTDLFEDNPSIVQILPPSENFNEMIANKIYGDNHTRKLLAVGEPDHNDGIASGLIALFSENNDQISLEEFGGFTPDLMEPVLIYSYASRKEDVSDFLKNVENLEENNPGFDFKIIGRTNWVAMLDEFGDRFSEYSIIIPSRIWLDETSKEWKNFTDLYESLFEGSPIRSIPNYAASGYDIAEFFIPAVAENHGDFSLAITSPSYFNSIQNDFFLKNLGPNKGLINHTSYLIKFHPDGTVEKIIVK
ncbi:MAG: LysM peptidoglycan-binding domain-containing protein [Muribaculaceae bacterium]|nr:LysM peptidoglycan-binding domain-containing protein [Muribaculaceae bacterium]